MEILCLGCGKPINLPEYVDSRSYDGEVRCPKCWSLLHIQLVNSKVLKYKMARQQEPPQLTADDMERAYQLLKEKTIKKLQAQGKSITEEGVLREILFKEPEG